MRVLLLLLGLCLAVPSGAWAARAAKASMGNGCYRHSMCVAQAAADTGACTDVSGGSEIVAELSGGGSHVAYFTESTAATFTCNIFTSAIGYHATNNEQVNSIAFTKTNQSSPLTGLLRFVWVNCSAIADNVINVELDSCPN